MYQNPIVKHNVQRYLRGEPLNAIYDGYTFMPLLMGQLHATSFSHYYDYEPHTFNHLIPHHGIFGRMYFKRLVRNTTSIASKYAGFKKNYGPPHWQYNPRYDDVENNEFLQKKGVSAADIKPTTS